MTSRKLDKCKYRQGKIEAHHSYCFATDAKVNRNICKECRLFEPKEAKKENKGNGQNTKTTN